MMFYTENRDKSKKPSRFVSYHNQNANRAFLTHVENLLILDKIAKTGNFSQKCDARAEIEICVKKIENRMKHVNFEITSEIATAMQELRNRKN